MLQRSNAAPSALLFFLNHDPGLTAGPTQCRPCGPQTTTYILRVAASLSLLTCGRMRVFGQIGNLQVSGAPILAAAAFQDKCVGFVGWKNGECQVSDIGIFLGHA